MRLLVLTTILVASGITGCASVDVQTSGRRLQAPLCEAGQRPVPTLVHWGTRWRPDQKEPTRREAAALRGIQDALARTDCLAVVAVNRLSTAQTEASDEELLRMVQAPGPRPERVLVVLVRELGPTLHVGIPIIVRGGTEVLIDVRVLDAASSKPLAGVQTYWRHGGQFVIKGVGTLDRDMSAALSAALSPSAGGPSEDTNPR